VVPVVRCGSESQEVVVEVVVVKDQCVKKSEGETNNKNTTSAEGQPPVVKAAGKGRGKLLTFLGGAAVLAAAAAGACLLVREWRRGRQAEQAGRVPRALWLSLVVKVCVVLGAGGCCWAHRAWECCWHLPGFLECVVGSAAD